VLQVELAALSYQRTRLVRAWTHLERQRGGFGFVGGPGETQIEADRRAIDEQVIRLKRSWKVVKTRELHRAARARCRSRSWRWWATPTPASPRCSTA
jgi:GTPase